MTIPNQHFSIFSEALQNSIRNKVFIKMNLGNYKGSIEHLKKCIVKPIMLKAGYKLSFTYRYATKDITKNFDTEEGLAILNNWISQKEFEAATLFTQSKNYILQNHHQKDWLLKEEKTNTTLPDLLQHDKVKTRKINDLNQSYLQELGLTNSEGKVYKEAQDKYKQINHYIDLLHPAILQLPQNKKIRVADMGSGKGYLTFALYDYLKQNLGIDCHIRGIEYRQDMVQLCNTIASNVHFDGLQFEEGGIADFQSTEGLDMLIALHACDTATDDAIYKGIQNNAQIIVTAPCCHKQIRREMERNKKQNEVSFLTQYGIFMERQAEMITDGIRALLLEYCGYKVKVMQFISDAHTPKNVMILAEKNAKVNAEKRASLLTNLQSIKTNFGISYHHLERLLGV